MPGGLSVPDSYLFNHNIGGQTLPLGARESLSGLYAGLGQQVAGLNPIAGDFHCN